MKDLKEIRTEIDQTDDKILPLFLHRMDLAAEAAEYKKEKKLGVTNKSREREILMRLSDKAKNGKAGQDMDLTGYVRVLYETMFEVSKSYQQRLNAAETVLETKIQNALEHTPKLFPQTGVIACRGQEGSYAQIACDQLFPVADIMYFKNDEAVFQAVEKGFCDFGLLPIENNSVGSFHEIYDLMRKYGFHIVKSINLSVRHALLAKAGIQISDIRKILSHSRAIGQCSGFLKQLGEGVKIIPCENTAAAAAYAAECEEEGVAAISSQHCAKLYGLSCIADSIENQGGSYTKFACISKELQIYPGADRISLMLALPHESGALYRMIAKFAALGLNLTKIESRPVIGQNYEYLFYLDMTASVYSPEVLSLLGELSQSGDFFAFLGNYSEI